PRRREILAEARIPFAFVDPDVPEDFEPALEPEAVVALLAERKARAAARKVPGGLVLGADTVVAVGSRILGKPEGAAQARAMLESLSGTTHRVLTGVCLVDAGTGRSRTEVDVTSVTMRELSGAEIDAYVASGEGDDKAGGYAIQETADRFVTRVEGSW